MSGLFFVGADPSDDSDVENRLNVEQVLVSGVSRDYADARTAALVATRASQTYVDNQDATYAPASYYPARDALLVPNVAKGAPNGVASMDGSSKILPAQVPALGSGILRGPWGANSVAGGSTDFTPLKIATWNVGTGNLGQVLVWLSTSIQSTGRPVVEIRMGTSTQTTYAAQTLIGQGFGRNWYRDYQVVTTIPATLLNEGQDGVQDATNPATSYVVNAWMFDDGGISTTTSTSIASAALYFARTAL